LLSKLRRGWQRPTPSATQDDISVSRGKCALVIDQPSILSWREIADALIDVIFINTKDSSRLYIECRFGEDSAPDLFSTVRGCELHDQLGSERSLRILTIR